MHFYTVRLLHEPDVDANSTACELFSRSTPGYNANTGKNKKQCTFIWLVFITNLLQIPWHPVRLVSYSLGLRQLMCWVNMQVHIHREHTCMLLHPVQLVSSVNLYRPMCRVNIPVHIHRESTCT